MSKTYTAESIQHLSGLEHIQKRKGMYISDIYGMFNEMFHNSLDEVNQGYGNDITVKFHKSGAISCQDSGRGIPTGYNAKLKMNSQDAVFLNTNTGGKFDSSSYDFSIGLHGLGNKVIVALSKYVFVKIKRDGKIFEAEYKEGGSKNKLSTETGKTKDSGTYVEFLPDAKYWGAETIDPEVVKNHLEEISYLFKNLTIHFENDIKGEKIDYHQENGIKGFIEKLKMGKTISEVFYIPPSKRQHGEEIEIALQFNNSDTNTIYSFVNLLHMVDGGTHEDGLKIGLYECLQDFAKDNKDAKIKDVKFEVEDVLEGLTCVIATKVPEKIIKFQGQVKSKLLTPELKVSTREIIQQYFTKWLNENKEQGKAILKKIYVSRDARKAASHAKIASKAMREGKKLKISDKYSKPIITDPLKNELWIAEGLSAKSSLEGAKSQYDGIFAIRGKLPNAAQWKLVDLLKNEEVQSIISIIGTGIGNDFNLKHLKFNRIYSAADADVDGYHINCLFLTLIYKLMPELIKQGKVFLAMSPLYMVTMKDATKKYFWDKKDLEAYQKTNKSKIDRVGYLKGLGESNSDVLQETTMSPTSRHCIKVSIQDAQKALKTCTMWMDKDVEQRKQWIEQNLTFEGITE